MKKTTIIILVVIAILCAAAVWLFTAGPLASTGTNDAEETEEMEKVAPVGPSFNADSAYAFTKAQCDFGPRDMNSKGHDACEQWIIKQFKRYGCTVTTQKADLKGYDGTTLKSTNIIASYNPGATTRIMLCAHWDSRPWADNDPTADLGIDFVCFDAEDWGTPQWSQTPDDGSSWALGAQYFSQHLPQGFSPRYAILLDMVGGQGAQFYQEGMSKQYAPEIVKKVWRAARRAGYGSFFPRQDGGMITDDHIPVNQTANIPCIDIIPYYPQCEQSSFGPTWHTLNDDMAHIDKNTLKAVGQTLVQVIFTELSGN